MRFHGVSSYPGPLPDRQQPRPHDDPGQPSSAPFRNPARSNHLVRAASPGRSRHRWSGCWWARPSEVPGFLGHHVSAFLGYLMLRCRWTWRSTHEHSCTQSCQLHAETAWSGPHLENPPVGPDELAQEPSVDLETDASPRRRHQTVPLIGSLIHATVGSSGVGVGGAGISPGWRGRSCWRVGGALHGRTGRIWIVDPYVTVVRRLSARGRCA